MMKNLIGLSFLLLISGCTNERISRNLSSGAIGCPVSQITIQNETASAIGGMHNWTAICNNQYYICSYQETTGVNCSALSKNEESKLGTVGGL